jgi:hypothetical protein
VCAEKGREAFGPVGADRSEARLPCCIAGEGGRLTLEVRTLPTFGDDGTAGCWPGCDKTASARPCGVLASCPRLFSQDLAPCNLWIGPVAESPSVPSARGAFGAAGGGSAACGFGTCGAAFGAVGALGGKADFSWLMGRGAS